ncbi:gamma-glutamyltransferase [Paenalcaligenes niemegkensis]|uniref:gamma-glutamyltransferase n=1 Tax=Paenalcaligenes niemegkensis TaxID=2895469 RepID=UPI001EE88933|nr:gamma-glutamyltransferase [Paenalcaligenes niemegkensis]MCQ9617750.1 gamma-glutamyltransferase [Paenalcaligenes niemegkensis]
MSSIFKRFGAGFVVPEGGFVLQNRGFGFSEPGHCNGPAPAKRPYHTVVPGAATKNGRFYMGLGVVGGLMQPQGQVQILNRVLRLHQPLDEAVFAPRWRIEAGHTLAIEKGTEADLATAYRKNGYDAPAEGVGDLAGRSDFGGAQAVMRTDAGKLWAVSDSRKDGVAKAG